jgi:hypothetical protein
VNSGALDVGEALKRGRNARHEDDFVIEDTLLQIEKRLDAIEHALGAVAQGVMALQKEKEEQQ